MSGRRCAALPSRFCPGIDISGGKMFDLEKAIKSWKKNFYKYEAFEDGLVADLELHLRDAYDSLREKGFKEKEAFKRAVVQVGTAESLSAEYDKNRQDSLNRRRPLRPARFMPPLIWNYIKIVFRKIKRQKGYSIINIAGLTIGMACCILLVLYIHSELSVDTFHKNADRIYALCVESEREGYSFQSMSSNATAAAVLQNDYPEVEQAVRYGYKPGANFLLNGKYNSIDRMMYADENVFEVFTWPMVKGNPKTALAAPHTIVISEDTAKKCFGETDPMGKVIEFGEDEAYVITGIIKNVPESSIFDFDALCSFKTLYTKDLGHMLTDWLSHNFNTFLLLEEEVDPEDLDAKLPALLEKYAGEDMKKRGAVESLFLHSLRQIYLNPPWSNRGPIYYVYIYSVVALLILLIACFNFMNLSTARAAARAQEVGLRKVMGAHRTNLINQFFSESLFFSFVSLILAVALAQALLPGISNLTRRTLSLNVIELPWLLPGFIVLTLIVGLAAGSYPALFLSRFMPVKVLRGKYGSTRSNTKLRRGLVVLQFVISITMVICTTIIIQQILFLQNKDAGYNKENVVVIPAGDSAIRNSLLSIKEEFKKNPHVVSVALSSTIPGFGYPNNSKIPEGHDESEAMLMDEINADYDYLTVLDLELAAGRNFSKEFSTDQRHAVIINETAAKRFGWDDPIGKTIKSYEYKKSGEQYFEATVIGVVKDFHFRNLTRSVEPVYIGFDPDMPFSYSRLDVISVRIHPENQTKAIESLKSQWEGMFSTLPFEYIFLDQVFGWQFGSIIRSRKILTYFTFLAIFVACLGLYGMASFAAAQRTKEIGIRKVLGSSIGGILSLLGKELMKLVLIANVAALPLSYFIMKGWIRNFPYRTDIGILTYLGASLAVLLIGVVTVSNRAVRAALANPVDSLQHE
jgi:putative ABC transport system permease protein